ncbi:MAG: DUF4386 domain-containing protein [Gemmatimonadota bacterium]
MRSGGGTIEPEQRAAARPSSHALSRIGGALYLTIIAIGAFGEMGIRSRIVVPGDALATAANLNALEALWRVGLVGELFLLICGTTLAAIFYILIRPVSRDGALLATFFNLVSLAVEAAMALYLAAALFPLTREEYRSAYQPEQLAALSLWSIQSHAYGFGLALVFFGCFCVVMGYLIYQSGFIPRTIGVLLLVAGACYVVNTFALILSPALSGRLFPWVLLPPFVAELSFALWLLLKGVRRA